MLPTPKNKTEKKIVDKILTNKRINNSDAKYLYTKTELSTLSLLSSFVKKQKHGDKIQTIKTYHIEPSNICSLHCKFCSFRKKNNETNSWKYTINEVLEKIKSKINSVEQVHIVGSINKYYDINFYTKLFQKIKELEPKIHLKALTAVEIEFISKLSKLTIEECLIKLKNSGMDSMPGGGAEIFNEEKRKIICPDKIDASSWLEVHRTAHKLGIKTNATMLYGHIETIDDRIEHLEMLRKLQDETDSFETFIPLKFNNKNNEMSAVKETTVIDDLKTFAIARIFLYNIPNIKAYWLTIGKELAKTSLEFGVNDLDGTLENSTKIY